MLLKKRFDLLSYRIAIFVYVYKVTNMLKLILKIKTFIIQKLYNILMLGLYIIQYITIFLVTKSST